MDPNDEAAAAAAAEAAAAQAAADKAAADKLAADKVAADKAAADAAEAVRLATKPTDAEARLLKDMMKQKERAKAASDELEALKKKYEGVDPDAARAAAKAVADAAAAELEAKGDWGRLKDQMNAQHAAELKAEQDKAAASAAEAVTSRSVIETLTIGAEFTASAFIKEKLVIPASKAKVIYGAHFEFEGGKTVSYDKPRGAKDRTMLVDARGEPLSFEEGFKKIVDADPDRDGILKSTARAGAGSGSLPGRKEDPVVVKMSGAEKIAKGLAAQKAKK